MNFEPKLKLVSVFVRKYQFTESNDFSKSMDNIMPGLFSNLVKKEMSYNSLIFFPINLPSRYLEGSV